MQQQQPQKSNAFRLFWKHSLAKTTIQKESDKNFLHDHVIILRMTEPKLNNLFHFVRETPHHRAPEERLALLDNPRQEKKNYKVQCSQFALLLHTRIEKIAIAFMNR